jgi:hypothetical protein
LQGPFDFAQGPLGRAMERACYTLVNKKAEAVKTRRKTDFPFFNPFLFRK